MIRPDPSTQFILYVFYGVHDWGLRRPRQGVDVILSIKLWLFARCVKPCNVMLENARSVILQEMINDLLCMNAEQ